MNTGKTLDNDGPASEMSRLQSSMLPAASLSIVVIANNHPALAFRLKKRKTNWLFKKKCHQIDKTITEIEQATIVTSPSPSKVTDFCNWTTDLLTKQHQTCHFDLTQNQDGCQKKSEFVYQSTFIYRNLYHIQSKRNLPILS